MKKHLLLWLLIVIFVVPGYSQIAQPAVPVNVAILVYNDVELLDFAGPLEVFSLAYRDTTKLFNVYTVGLNNESITSQKALRITPQYSLENCPVPNILVLPGGDTRVIKKNEELIKWITKSIDSIDIALSVCTGVSILGEAGLLDNQRATTHKYAIERMQENYPKASFLANTRFVDNGKIITTAGISAGIDGALYVVQRLFGEEVARDIVDWMEYDSWRPDNGLIMVNRKTIIQDLCWSPDNIYVYFSAMKVKPDFSDYSPQLWTVYRFDTNKKNIKPIEKSALNVAVSPSGNQLAIAKNEIDQRNIFILDEDGKDIWALVIGDANISAPSWSPDGKNIAFSGTIGGIEEIYSYRIDDHKPAQLTHSQGHKALNPVWSPDGKHIVYYLEKGDGQDQIYVMKSDGTENRNITNDTFNNIFPGWIDNRTIIYGQGHKNARTKAYQINIDGTNKRQVLHIESMYARYSPDGSKIACIDEGEGVINVFSSTGKSLYKITIPD